MTRQSTCESCDAVIVIPPAKARRPARPLRYCSNACRQRAYRQRSDVVTPEVVLPVPPDLFVGRDEELADLSRLTGQTRLLTILGPAGIGKTRLACELVKQVKRSFTGGVHLVELAPTIRAAEVPKVVAAAVGAASRRGDATVDTVATALADRKVLLVLDTCEHVLGACGELVDALLRRCPRLVILTTSRETLRLRGETVYRLRGLGLADPAGGAVRLFHDRARASVPDFTPTTETDAGIAALCELLDGVPLAIEFAARMVRLLPITEIADRLDDWLPTPALNPSGADRRHRSLGAAIDWSYELLEPDERAAFRRLSVLAGGFGLDAARAVCADGDMPGSVVLSLVASLDAKSLIAPVTDSTHAARYQMLESIRRYGLERLRAEGEETATQQRLVEWLSSLAGPIPERATLFDIDRQRLRDEHDNIVRAMEWLDGSGDERQLLLAGALVVAHYRWRPMDEAQAWLSRALESTDPESQYRGFALTTAAWLAAWLGESERTLSLALEGLALERRWMRPAMLARLHRVAAHGWRARDDGEAAADSLRECLRLCRHLGDRIGAAQVLHMLASEALDEGDLRGGTDMVDEALSIAREAGDPAVLRATLHTAGMLAVEHGDLPRAYRMFTESIRHFPDGALGVWGPIEGLAVVSVRAGWPERGLRLLAAAGRMRDEEGSGAALSGGWWQRRVDESAAAARESLPAGRTAAAVEVGRVLGLRETVDYALADPERGDRDDGRDGTTDGPRGLPTDPPLGRREWHVATLVAQGLTNDQIASRMHVSLRTVEAHLRNIRTKLELRSRAHLAAWFTEHAPGKGWALPNLNHSSS